MPFWSASGRRAPSCSPTACGLSPRISWPPSPRHCLPWSRSRRPTPATHAPADRPPALPAGRPRWPPSPRWPCGRARNCEAAPEPVAAPVENEDWLTSRPSEEQGGEGRAGLGDPRVPGREDLEEADQVPPRLVPVRAGGPPYLAEQPV